MAEVQTSLLKRVRRTVFELSGVLWSQRGRSRKLVERQELNELALDSVGRRVRDGLPVIWFGSSMS